MDNMMWAKHMLKDKEAQKVLEEKAGLLVTLYFKDKSDYAIEKLIRSFGESFIYLEDSLLLQRNIHPSKFEENKIYLMANKEETMKKMGEVSLILINEINRQYRHFQTFLSELS